MNRGVRHRETLKKTKDNEMFRMQPNIEICKQVNFFGFPDDLSKSLSPWQTDQFTEEQRRNYHISVVEREVLEGLLGVQGGNSIESDHFLGQYIRVTFWASFVATSWVTIQYGIQNGPKTGPNI